MTWTYVPAGNPEAVDRDKVRFLIGDTCTEEQLVLDEEIDYALSEYSELKLAAAVVLRALAAKCTREVSFRVGDVSKSGVENKAKGYLALAEQYDPNDITVEALLGLPRFGGLTHSEKEDYAEDSDAVQPYFSREENDIPGGPPDGTGS